MVKSLCCKYEDVVAMVPLPAINSSVIKKWYDNVLQARQSWQTWSLKITKKEAARKKSSFSCSIAVPRHSQ
ncbi:Putative LOC100207826 [Caligus rogercresseyi]|uniref:LOC100207826 n=1 Tax=Caligus rogercresseyi TaxID=217165 RepID=A0A7T8JXL5_CALRO|nr:Putative LOC100207826 [Caligus rogercresseyi]